MKRPGIKSVNIEARTKKNGGGCISQEHRHTFKDRKEYRTFFFFDIRNGDG